MDRWKEYRYQVIFPFKKEFTELYFPFIDKQNKKTCFLVSGANRNFMILFYQKRYIYVYKDICIYINSSSIKLVIGALINFIRYSEQLKESGIKIFFVSCFSSEILVGMV